MVCSLVMVMNLSDDKDSNVCAKWIFAGIAAFHGLTLIDDAGFCVSLQHANPLSRRVWLVSGHFDRWRAALKYPGNTSVDSAGRD